MRKDQAQRWIAQYVLVLAVSLDLIKNNLCMVVLLVRAQQNPVKMDWRSPNIIWLLKNAAELVLVRTVL